MGTCPKCGSQMTGGGCHGPWAVQLECHHCGYVVTGSSVQEAQAKATNEKVKP